MKPFHIIITILALFCSTAFGEDSRVYLPDYSSGTSAMTSTPGTYGGALGGFWNPAAWAAMQRWEAALEWNDQNIRPKRMDRWSLAMGGHGVGFAMRSQSSISPLSSPGFSPSYDRLNDYHLGLAGGSPDNYWGLSYNWSKGGSFDEQRDHYLTLGTIWRPFSYLSVGSAASFTLDENDYNGQLDLGLRPFQTHRLTFFGDLAAGQFDSPERAQWGIGAEFQPINGLRAALKMSKPYADVSDKIFSLSLGASIDGMGFHVIPHFDKDQEQTTTSFIARVGEQEPTVDPARFMGKGTKLVSMSMKGRTTYQKEKIGAASKIPLLPTIEMIEKAKNNPAVGGIALNLSGFQGSRELVWEIREKLLEFRAAGKQVYIYIDDAGMTGYYLASAADYLWINQQGMIQLPGFIAGRTFWKGFFDKIGLGVEEWRFFTYKSAFEQLSRKNMSEADREQRLAFISDFYDEWLTDVSVSRELTVEQVSAGIDSLGIYTSQEAYEAGLVDSIGKWDDVKDFAEALTGKKPDTITPHEATHEKFAAQDWGKLPEIAIVYALGECDMDTGIKARTTSRTLRRLANDKHTKAVVLRADSPGGDGMASDIVAEEMKTVSAQKPMIVSQGGVAGSGGYWISMYGDRIFSSPFTITGSIGVIGGWVWNEKVSEKTGFTSDHVKRGAHADLGFGITIPLIGVQIPDRQLDDYEHRRMEKLIRGMYTEFTEKVAGGRFMTAEQVDSIGQGRVWTGKAALANGLVDELGGLEQAVNYAKSSAKLSPKTKVNIVEYPKAGWLNPELFGQPGPISMLSRLLIGSARDADIIEAPDYELRYWQRISAGSGKPLYMVPPEDLPPEDK